MARINIEDSLWDDARFLLLSHEIGELKAIGSLVKAFKLAQSFWVRGELIPFDLWKAHRLPKALEAHGLAEHRESGVYVRGSEQQFEWLISCRKNGKNGGRPKALDNKDLKNRRVTHAKPTPNPLTLPLSPSLPLSQKKELKASAEKSASPISEFIGTYIKAFQARFPGGRPDLSGKVQGSIKRVLSDIPLQRACAMIQVYMQMDDQWFKTKSYDFETFAQNLTKVGLALDTGQNGGMSDWERKALAEEETRRNGAKRLSGSVAADQALLRGKALPAGAGGNPLAGSERPDGGVDDDGS